jgi:hypothetical protein
VTANDALPQPPRGVHFSDQPLPPPPPAADPYQDQLNKSDIEKVIEKRIGGSKDYSDLMLLYTARGR